MTEYNDAAKVVYREGVSPIDWAIQLAEIQIDVLDTIRTARATSPASFPGYFLELTPEACARRIVGELLDAGWTPPEVSR